MNISIVMFSVLSAVIVIFSILTVLTRRILRAALYLLFVLVATAGLYFMLNYEFLAGIQLTLYAGGIVVLIIFSILLTSHISYKFEIPKVTTVLMALLVAVFGLSISVYSILEFPFQQSQTPEVATNVDIIGKQLLDTGKNGYALPFEVISILLLAAMIGSIVIAKKDKIQENI
jgi:NADH-quinone oxidoreductase subunit J